MLDFMRDAGIGTNTVRRLDHRTVGLYMIQLEKGERSFAYWRGQSAARALADDPDWLDGVFARASVVVFSGITLAILTEEARGAFCASLARARASGVQTVFDTNMRARLWSGAEAMRAGIMQGAAQADIVLPSFDEEEDVFGDTSPRTVAARYHGAGASLVVVKNGTGEMLISDTKERQFTQTPKLAPKIVDTTAAGDSFDAGFLAARLQGADLRDAVAQGARLAADVVQAPGALVETG
jgi:2-dehydro-3-deoxygluconokinase